MRRKRHAKDNSGNGYRDPYIKIKLRHTKVHTYLADVGIVYTSMLHIILWQI